MRGISALEDGTAAISSMNLFVLLFFLLFSKRRKMKKMDDIEKRYKKSKEDFFAREFHEAKQTMDNQKIKNLGVFKDF